jgi:hypothetical protein
MILKSPWVPPFLLPFFLLPPSKLQWKDRTHTTENQARRLHLGAEEMGGASRVEEVVLQSLGEEREGERGGGQRPTKGEGRGRRLQTKGE